MDEITTMNRTASLPIGGVDHELLLTTGATRQIAARYGGLDHLGDKLLAESDPAEALGEIVWLVTLLANQAIKVHNHTHPNDPRPELTEETVELLTSPADLAEAREAITAALVAGTRRDITSMPEASAGKAPDGE